MAKHLLITLRKAISLSSPSWFFIKLKQPAFLKYTLSLIFYLALFFTTPLQTMADEEYRFERMWPALQQPWYFDYPCGIAIAPDDSVYVADRGHDRIQKFSASGQFVAKWGSGDGEFNEPRGIAIALDGSVYVADSHNHRIQKFTPAGQFVMKWGSFATEDGEFVFPLGIAIDSNAGVIPS